MLYFCSCTSGIVSIVYIIYALGIGGFHTILSICKCKMGRLITGDINVKEVEPNTVRISLSLSLCRVRFLLQCCIMNTFTEVS